MLKLRYSTFRQSVRAFRPSDLLPAIAVGAAADAQSNGFQLEWRSSSPWALAAIARESILYGNEFRFRPITENSIRRLINEFNNVYDQGPGGFQAGNTLAAIFYEQFPYQESLFEEISRTRALLIDTRLERENEISDAEWEGLLGAPLDEVIGATFILNVGAAINNGRFDPAWLDMPHFQEVFTIASRQSIERTLERLTATVPDAKADGLAAPRLPEHLAKYSYNPLSKTPFILLPGLVPIAPQPRLIMRTSTPGGLYYAGLRQWDQAFTRELGAKVEAYVGRQLESQGDLEIYPEVAWGRPEQKSVDWFVVTDDAVILIECKSGRLPLAARAGADSLTESLRREIGKAYNQIGRTVETLRESRAEFSHLPSDRKFIGLVVTAEPFYGANSQFTRPDLPTISIPTLTLSLRNLEHLVSLDSDTLIQSIIRIAEDPELSKWEFGASLGEVLGDNRRPVRNKILDDAWAAYSWVNSSTFSG